MMEVKQSSLQGQTSFRSINSIILRFPRFKEGLKEIRGVFELYGMFNKIFPYTFHIHQVKIMIKVIGNTHRYIDLML